MFLTVDSVPSTLPGEAPECRPSSSVRSTDTGTLPSARRVAGAQTGAPGFFSRPMSTSRARSRPSVTHNGFDRPVTDRRFLAPTRGRVAGPRMLGIHEGVGQRASASRMPVVRKGGQRKTGRVRGERRYANAGQETPVVPVLRPLVRCPGNRPAPASLRRRGIPSDCDATKRRRSRALNWRPSSWGWCDAERHGFTSLGATGSALKSLSCCKPQDDETYARRG